MESKPPVKLHHEAVASRRAHGHEERMIDESVEQSFPASDPSSTSQPGSIVSRRYAAVRGVSRTSSTWAPLMGWFVVTTAIACTAILVLKWSRRR